MPRGIPNSQGTCTAPDCTRVHKARGWCALHYHRWQRRGTIELPDRSSCQVADCGGPGRRRGWCPNHYMKWFRYGVDPQVLDELLAQQDGVCGLCGTEATLVIDHDHDTGAVRGLLCIACNTGLGKLGDTVESLEAAIAYLRRQPDRVANAKEK